MRFEFATAQRILFGPGALREVGGLAKALGSHPMVVTGGNPARSEILCELLGREGLNVDVFSVVGEPTVAKVMEGAECACSKGRDLILAFGGGAALDAGKAIAALATNAGDPLRYLEVIGDGRPLEQRPLPLIAIPTTAGTGSEVTRNAVLTSPEQGVKVSLRHAWMLPSMALVDPELTYTLPPELTASTGLDALTQLIEPFLSIKANPMTDAFCREGIQRAARALRKACMDGKDAKAREDMALASLLGGMALANAGLGAVHGIAAPLGGCLPVPHGVACAALLPHAMAVNLRTIRAQLPLAPVLARFQEVGRLLTGDSEATADEGVEWISSLVADLRIPRLSNFGLTSDLIPQISERSAKASSMQANPVKLGSDAIQEILNKAL